MSMSPGSPDDPFHPDPFLLSPFLCAAMEPDPFLCAMDKSETLMKARGQGFNRVIPDQVGKLDRGSRAFTTLVEPRISRAACHRVRVPLRRLHPRRHLVHRRRRQLPRRRLRARHHRRRHPPRRRLTRRGTWHAVPVRPTRRAQGRWAGHLQVTEKRGHYDGPLRVAVEPNPNLCAAHISVQVALCEKAISKEHAISLSHGDIYAMSWKATGHDWRRSSLKTLRHGVGRKAKPRAVGN